MNAHVRFGTYHRQDYDHRFERYFFNGLGQRSKDDLMLLISPSTTPTLVERLGGSSSSPPIIGKFFEALIPIDAVSGEDE